MIDLRPYYGAACANATREFTQLEASHPLGFAFIAILLTTVIYFVLKFTILKEPKEEVGLYL